MYNSYLFNYTVVILHSFLYDAAGLISAARGDSDIGAEIITKRRKNLKKEMIHAERRRRRIERMESLENDHDNELEAVEEDEEENDEDVDVDEDNISLSTIDSRDDDDDQMYLSTTDPPSSHLQSEMMVSFHVVYLHNKCIYVLVFVCFRKTLINPLPPRLLWTLHCQIIHNRLVKLYAPKTWWEPLI